jgi:hypothetical protein
MRGEKIWPALSIVQGVKKDGWSDDTLLGIPLDEFKLIAHRLKFILLVSTRARALNMKTTPARFESRLAW